MSANRFECLTVRELFCGLNINDPDCDNKICTLNRILRDFYTQISNTKLSKLAVAFSGWGFKTIEMPYWLKQVHNIIVKWNCLWKKCFVKMPTCNWFDCDGLYEFIAQQVWSEPAVWQYYISKENDKQVVKLNLPDWVTEWWIVYSRAWEVLEDLDDEICIDPNALVLLQYMIKEVYAEDSREINMASYYRNKFDALLKRELENQEKLPYRIIWLHQIYQDTNNII